VTAGNASGLNDGAAAVVMMSAPSARSNSGLTPLARIKAYSTAGRRSEAIMGMGPVPASQKRCLKKAGWKPPTST
jgi:acetyl-CoA C-acetyltransferase